MKANLHDDFYGGYTGYEIKEKWPTIKSENLSWTNDETDLSIYLENPRHWIEYVKNGNGSKYNVLVMIEPISLTKHETSTDTEVYDIIKLKENYELFDMIFTTYPEYSDIDSRFKYYPGGLRSYIKKGHWGIYKKLENTCMLASKKNILEGHKLRQQIKWGCVPEMSDINYKALFHQRMMESLLSFIPKIHFPVTTNPEQKYDLYSDKMDLTGNYMFEIVVENEKGDFFSEKILDAMLVGSIPIYWSDGVEKDKSLSVFDTNGIITFETIQDLKNIMDMRFSYLNIGEYTSRGDSIKHNFEVAKKYSSMGEVLWIHGIKELMGG